MKPETLDKLRLAVDTLSEVALAIRAESNDVLATRDHVEVIKHFNSLRVAKDDIKASREVLDEVHDSLSVNGIPDLFRELKEKTGEKPPFKIEGIGTVTVSYKYNASILDGKKPEAFDWLRSNNAAELIQETVNAQTLSAFAKSLMEDKGEELPTDTFKTGTKPYTSIRK